MHPRVQQSDQRIQCGDADPGKALRQHIRAQEERRAHGSRRQRIADAGRVTAQQIQLQRLERVRRDLDIGKRTKAGVDAVGGIAAARSLFDDQPRRLHAVTRWIGERDRFVAIGNRHHLFECE